MPTLALRQRTIAVLFGVAFAVAAHSAHGAPPATMPVADVRDGMRGHGLTVFSGTKIDTFDVEVLAVLRGYGIQNDAIVARLSGGPLEETGVAQGMSGSPVFIGGKLVGAVAWTSTFTKEPLAGITPWEYMARIPERQMTEPGPDRYTQAPIFPNGVPADVAQQAAWWRAGDPATERDSSPRLPASWAGRPDLARAAGMEMMPVETPLAVSGINPKALGILGEIFTSTNARVVQGGAAGTVDLDGVELEPGSSLGVTLIQGDISVVAVGTVTWRDGNTIVGFGHPMFFKGQIDLPMSLAYVHFLWPSQFISYKMASAGPVVGALRQDRRFGVAGVIGADAPMLPVEIAITGGPRPHTIRYEVARDREFGPQLVSLGLLTALYDLENISGPASVELEQTIEIAGRPPIRRKNFYTNYGGLGMAAMAAGQPLTALASNPFEPVRIEKVSFAIRFREDIEAAYLTGLEIPRRVVRPGEPLVVKARMKSYLGREFDVAVELPITDDTPEGVYTLRVGDAASARRWATERAPGRFAPTSLDHLVGILNYEERNDQLTLEMVNDEVGMTVDEQVLPSLPPTTFQMLRIALPTGDIGPVRGVPISRVQKPIGLYVIGNQEIPVAVYRQARPR